MTGSLRSITIATHHGGGLEGRQEATLVAGIGIEGDRYAGTIRQVTLVCTGEVEEASALFGSHLDAAATRRNLVVDLPRLPRRHGARILIAGTELEVWRDCSPCEVLDAIFGPGAREALEHRAGVSAQVIRGGVIRPGDPVEVGDP
jgi:MOSC domain-containing protein YiiM